MFFGAMAATIFLSNLYLNFHPENVHDFCIMNLLTSKLTISSFASSLKKEDLPPWPFHGMAPIF
jgi:hypothetical protein